MFFYSDFVGHSLLERLLRITIYMSRDVNRARLLLILKYFNLFHLENKKKKTNKNISYNRYFMQYFWVVIMIFNYYILYYLKTIFDNSGNNIII